MTVRQSPLRNLQASFGRFVVTALLLLLSLTTLFPFIWMLSTSGKLEINVFEYPLKLIPQPVNFIENYREVIQGPYNFTLYYRNSIEITVITTVLQVVFSAMAGFAFSKLKFVGRNTLFVILVSTMMIPEQVLLVPRFIMSSSMGLYDTHAIIIILLSFSVYGMFLMRQYMVSIPLEMTEAARIDGASYWQQFSRVVLPMSKPIVVTLAILKFVWTWNDYQTPLIFVHSRELYTIQQGIRQFANESGAFYSLMMAACVIAVLPLILIYLLGQKYIEQGMTAGAVKG